MLITGLNSSSQEIAKLYTNNGSGVFTEVTSTPFDGVYFSSIAFSDIDGDNDQDVLITGFNSSFQEISRLYTNNGSGTFTVVTGTPFDGIFGSLIEFADVDGDNDQDVMITGQSNSGLFTAKLYTNNGNGVFTEVIGTPFDGVLNGSIAFADIDGDNDQDVLITGFASSNQRIAKLYTNNGSGVFTEVTGTPFDELDNSSIAFADVDGDNDQDVMITGLNNSFQNSAKLYRNKSCLPMVGTHNETICFGDSITVNNTVYNAANLTGTETFTNVGLNNCDSVVTVTLTILPQLTGTHNETVCFGDSITVNNTVYNAANLTGTETFTNAGLNNCDSVVTVTLTIENQIDVMTTTSGFNIIANQTGATYQWVDCNNGNSPIAGETDSIYTATTNGDYAVVVTMGSCSDTSACTTITITGINNYQSSINNLQLFPNPTTGNITITNNEFVITNISIVTITGKGVYNLNNVNKKQLQISLSDFSKGIYFVKIQSNNQQEVIKLIKK